MKLINVTNVDGLFDTIDKCKGKVMLVNDDINLNLKSKLTQYFSIAKLFSDGEISELYLETENKEDFDRLLRFMMEQ